MDEIDGDGAILALEEHLRHEQDRLEERRRELDRARELVARVTSRSLGAADSERTPVPRPEAATVVRRLLLESRGLLRNFVLTIDHGPALEDDTMAANRARIDRGDPQRSAYPADVLATQHGQQWLETWAEVGEEQRILPRTGTEFAVFGDAAVVALAEWDDLDAGYVVLRDPLVVHLYAAYFDLAWRSGVPAPGGTALGPGGPRLVELLELGLKDEAIARHLGVSLRTVRRWVAQLMSEHGVDTRFQLGWVLAERREGGPAR